MGAYGFGDRIGRALGGTPGTPVVWLQREDWGAYWSWVLGGWPYRIGTIFETWRIPKVLAIIMLGLWAGRRLVEGKLLEDRRFLKRVAVAGLAIGLPANLVFAMSGGIWQDDEQAKLIAHIAHAFGVVPLSLGYAASFAILWSKAPEFLRPLAAPGRMALTKLPQSLSTGHRPLTESGSA